VLHTFGEALQNLVMLAQSRRALDACPLESAFLQLLVPSTGAPGGTTVTQAALRPKVPPRGPGRVGILHNTDPYGLGWGVSALGTVGAKPLIACLHWVMMSYDRGHMPWILASVDSPWVADYVSLEFLGSVERALPDPDMKCTRCERGSE
jgi:hypothetical protein